MIEKDGRLESAVYLSWVRRQPCHACVWLIVDPPQPAEPHHIDGKGMGGARCRDDRTVPLCRVHHDESHAYGGAPWSGRLGEWSNEMLRRFLDTASSTEIKVYILDLERYRSRPTSVPW